MKIIILSVILVVSTRFVMAEDFPKQKDCFVNISDSQMINVKYLESIKPSGFNRAFFITTMTSGNKLLTVNLKPKEEIEKIFKLIKETCQ